MSLCRWPTRALSDSCQPLDGRWTPIRRNCSKPAGNIPQLCWATTVRLWSSVKTMSRRVTTFMSLLSLRPKSKRSVSVWHVSTGSDSSDEFDASFTHWWPHNLTEVSPHLNETLLTRRHHVRASDRRQPHTLQATGFRSRLLGGQWSGEINSGVTRQLHEHGDDGPVHCPVGVAGELAASVVAAGTRLY